MRIVSRWDRVGQRRLLVARPERGESVDQALLKRVSSADETVFLPLWYEGRGRRRGEAVAYQLDDLMSLRRTLRRSLLSAAQLRQALLSVGLMSDACLRLGIGQSQVVFDARHVYVDASSRLRFVCVPIAGLAFDATNTPLSLLRELCVGGVGRRVSASDHALVGRLREFVEGEGGIFSPNDFRRFVADEVGGLSRMGTEGNPGGAKDGSYVLRDLTSGAAYPLRAGKELLMGRGSNCDVRVGDCHKVSRTHAVVRMEGADVVLRDLGSTNGTMVAGRRLDAHRDVRVPPGQVFALWKAPFCVESRGEEVV